MGHPKRKFIFQPLIFRGYVSFREGKYSYWSTIPSKQQHNQESKSLFPKRRHFFFTKSLYCVLSAGELGTANLGSSPCSDHEKRWIYIHQQFKNGWTKCNNTTTTTTTTTRTSFLCLYKKITTTVFERSPNQVDFSCNQKMYEENPIAPKKKVNKKITISMLVSNQSLKLFISLKKCSTILLKKSL